MQTRFIEVTNGPQNWGKVMVARFDAEEWTARSAVDPASFLLAGRGWSPNHVVVWDLQTGEGAIFLPGGSAKADLEKHRIWVCPLFEPFLGWLYEQDLRDLEALPSHVDLPDAPFLVAGYRRPGPQTEALVEEGWWHPNVKSGQVHDHTPGQPPTMHRLCEPVYTKRTVDA